MAGKCPRAQELRGTKLRPVRRASSSSTCSPPSIFRTPMCAKATWVQLPIGMSMADAERELLLATLRHCGGNKRRTADVLRRKSQDCLQQARRVRDRHACGDGPVAGRDIDESAQDYNEIPSRLANGGQTEYFGSFWCSPSDVRASEGSLNDCESMIGSPHRVFLADDHALFREGVKALLAEESGYCGCRRGGNGQGNADPGPQRALGRAPSRHLASRWVGHRSSPADSSAQAGPADPDPVDAPGGAVCRESVARRGDRLHHEGRVFRRTS